MNDQADNLRMAIERLSAMRVAEPEGRRGRARPAGRPRVVTVTSGKGGVGKTNISVNLALALSEMGYRPLIVDADIGLANVEVLFGMSPGCKLNDILSGDKSIRDIVAEGPYGVGFISGGSGFDELSRMDGSKVGALFAGLSELDGLYDAYIIDTGAGISDTVVSMAAAADEALIVTTPEPTSVTDAYALIKAIASRNRAATMRLIVNKAESGEEADDIMSRLTRVTGKFLDLKLWKLGYILNDPLVVRAVKQQQPLLIGYPHSRTSKCIREIASRLTEGGTYAPPEKGRGLSGFFDGIFKYVNVQLK